MSRGHSTAKASRSRKSGSAEAGASHTCFKPAKNQREDEINKAHGGKMLAPYNTSPIPPDEDVSGRLCIEAAGYIEGYHHKENPFFLWLSIPEPHNPYMAPEPYASMYRDAEIPAPVGREGEMDTKESAFTTASPAGRSSFGPRACRPGRAPRPW